MLSQKSDEANRKERLVRNLTNRLEKSTPSVRNLTVGKSGLSQKSDKVQILPLVRNLTNGEVALVRYLTKPKVIRFSVRYVGQGLQVSKFDLGRWGRR